MDHHRVRGRLIAATLVWVAVIAAACTERSESAEPAARSDQRILEITMTDNAFSPDRITVEEGEQIRFRFHNDGAQAHEAYIASREDQEAHHAEMRSTGHGGHARGERSDAITLDPGESGELTHRFDETGEFLIGCHFAGHYESGMAATVEVGRGR
jgi:uncharacterized cupredoxin-like copper-binding protein